MTLAEAAALLGVRPATLRQQIKRRRLRATRRGRDWYVTAPDVEEYRARYRRDKQLPIEFTPEDVAAFWARVTKSNGCWLFKTPRPSNYGSLVVHGENPRPIRAHRYSYALHHGEIPSGLQVMHLCDTPACVNPAHLAVGTPQENALDKVAKGRDGWPRYAKEHRREPHDD